MNCAEELNKWQHIGQDTPMKRSMAIFLWILLGALASGLAIGFFLHRANTDRERLVMEIDKAKQQAEETMNANRKLVAEADQKLSGASAEVDHAQELIKQYELERDLLLHATRLDKPTPNQLRSWKTFLSLPLGISLQTPPGSYATSNEALVSVRIDDSIAGGSDWLDITLYDRAYEVSRAQELVDATSTLTYLVDGHLLSGVRGRIRDTAVFGSVLRVMAHGTTTHLLWLRPRVGISDQTILRTLATLIFRS